jgi:uncharacterized SAM-binding protein YcdF (DUF218 family)
MLHQILKALILPPAGPALLVLLGVLLWRRPLGRALALLGALATLVLSLPITAAHLIAGLEPYPALTPDALAHPQAQAILVLGGDRSGDSLEYGRDDLGPLTLQRVRYAAWLQRRTGLPLFVSGGSPPWELPPLGQLMRRVLEQEFQVPVAGVDDRSQTTWENARYSAALLRTRGIARILLVSQAWHLPRAVRAFERQGVEVVPAPTGSLPPLGGPLTPGDLLPSAHALTTSWLGLHEYLGGAWYALRALMEPIR